MSADIVGVGQCVMDRIVRVEALPAPGRTTVTTSDVEVGGGMTANALVAASHLGLRTAIVAGIGDDDTGRRIRRDLEMEGVDTRGLVARPGTRSPSWMMVFDAAGDRLVMLFNRDTMQSPLADDVDPALFDGARVYFTDFNAPAASEHAAGLARARGLKIACDMQASLGAYERLGISEAHIRGILDRADLFMPSVDGVKSLTGKREPRRALERIMAQYPRVTIALTLGADGSLIAAGGEIITVPAFPVAVVDIVGAGDTYHAALVYGLYFAKWPPPRAGRFASAAAAIKCMRVGGRSGPTRAEVESFLAQRE
ncbi:MAG: carbohydrate kinase family protein [Chloroflexi bacterium]|nr:carbohydrate kinase family protein [Chloroflexota bacterium]